MYTTYHNHGDAHSTHNTPTARTCNASHCSLVPLARGCCAATSQTKSLVKNVTMMTRTARAIERHIKPLRDALVKFQVKPEVLAFLDMRGPVHRSIRNQARSYSVSQAHRCMTCIDRARLASHAQIWPLTQATALAQATALREIERSAPGTTRRLLRRMDQKLARQERQSRARAFVNLPPYPELLCNNAHPDGERVLLEVWDIIPKLTLAEEQLVQRGKTLLTRQPLPHDAHIDFRTMRVRMPKQWELHISPSQFILSDHAPLNASLTRTYSYTRALRNRRIKKQTKRFWRETIRNGASPPSPT
jgi:hypothetical protein